MNSTDQKIMDVLRGCGIAVVLFLLFVLGSCQFIKWADTLNRLPPQVEYWRVATSSTSLLGPLEGCSYAVYDLTPATIANLKWKGVGFLIGTRPAHESKDNPYDEWKETPLLKGKRSDYAEGTSIDAVSASDGCGSGSDSAQFPVLKSLMERGSFYSMTQNEEGMILIYPSIGRAVFMYYG